MEPRIDYFSASGTSGSAACFLAQRYDPNVGFKRLESESLVVVLATGADRTGIKGTLVFSTTGRLVELWRSLDGQVFVAEALGELLRWNVSNVGQSGSPWQTDRVDARLQGVWGLNESLVFAFGRNNNGSAVFLWNGSNWKPASAPSFEIEAMHGLTPQNIWACGAGGKVAQWTNGAWRELKVPTNETLLSIFVVSDDELYATGNMGTVFEGSSYGWANIGSIPGALQGDVQAVAKFADQVWVGASRLGLWQRLGKTNDYQCIKPNIPAVSFDTRGGVLLIGAEIAIITTADGKAFTGTAQGLVARLRGNSPLGSF